MSLATIDPETEYRYSAREFNHQLFDVWGFTRVRDDKSSVIIRSPHGHRMKIHRSLNGLADVSQVEKAAGTLKITVTKFWGDTAKRAKPTLVPHPKADRAPARAAKKSASPVKRKKPVTTNAAIVLGAYVAANRSMSCDEVVDIIAASGNTISRRQVSQALCQLSKNGKLERTAWGQYRWVGGESSNDEGPADIGKKVREVVAEFEGSLLAKPVAPAPELVVADVNTPAQQVSSSTLSTQDMFELLFPNGVRMTADMLGVLDDWKRLTGKLLELAN